MFLDIYRPGRYSPSEVIFGYNPENLSLTGPVAPWIDERTTRTIQVIKDTCVHILTATPEPWARPYSWLEYVTLAAVEAARAAETGNRAVGAIVIYRVGETEYIIGGHNQCAILGSSHPHAEEVAIDNYESFRNTGKPPQGHLFIKRPAPVGKPTLAIASTLECCMGCLRRIISSKFQEVMYAHPDPNGGQLAVNRLSCIPPGFIEKMRKVNMNIVGPYEPSPSELAAYTWQIEQLVAQHPTYVPGRINIFRVLSELDTRIETLISGIEQLPPTSFGMLYPELRPRHLLGLAILSNDWNRQMRKQLSGFNQIN